MAQQILKGLSCLLAFPPAFSSSARYSFYNIYVTVCTIYILQLEPLNNQLCSIMHLDIVTFRPCGNWISWLRSDDKGLFDLELIASTTLALIPAFWNYSKMDSCHYNDSVLLYM